MVYTKNLRETTFSMFSRFSLIRFSGLAMMTPSIDLIRIRIEYSNLLIKFLLESSYSQQIIQAVNVKVLHYFKIFKCKCPISYTRFSDYTPFHFHREDFVANISIHNTRNMFLSTFLVRGSLELNVIAYFDNEVLPIKVALVLILTSAVVCRTSRKIYIFSKSEYLLLIIMSINTVMHNGII